MTPGGMVLLAAQAGLFAVWGWLMFRTLFRLRARAVQATGRVIPGLGATLATFRDFFVDPALARDRRQLGLVTLALFALTLLFTLTRP